MKTLVRNVAITPQFIVASIGENTSHTSRECNLLKTRAAEKEKSKYVKKYYKKKFKEINFLQAEAAHQKYKYEKIYKAFTKRKISKEETVNIADSSNRNL